MPIKTLLHCTGKLSRREREGVSWVTGLCLQTAQAIVRPREDRDENGKATKHLKTHSRGAGAKAQQVTALAALAEVPRFNSQHPHRVTHNCLFQF